MSSTVPVKRRTRAMGASPGGFKSLDLDAPTRRRNATRATSITETAQPITPASRTQTKRKNEDVADAEDRPTKRTRGTNVPKAHKAPKAPRAKTRRNANSRELTDINHEHNAMVSGVLQAPQQQYDPREHTSEDEHRLEEEGVLEDPMSETDKENDTRINKQQPTPPAEVQENIRNKTPSSAKRHLAISQDIEPHASTRQFVKKTPQPDRVISNILDMNRRMMEDYETEKPLSDCDDDEFAARLPSVLAQAGQTDHPKSSSRPNSNVAYWVTKGNHAVFLRNRVSATEQKGSPREHNFTTPSISSQGIPHMERRELTNITVIDAISAGIDWFEKNRNGPLPTPAEMSSLLDEFKRSKQSPTTPFRAQQLNSSKVIKPHLNAVKPLPPPQQSVTSRNDSDDSSELDSDGDEMIAGQKERIKINNQDSEVVDEPVASLTALRTPPSQQEPQPGRGWASALSANLISNVLRTPASWFTRRGRTRQDLSATEPQPMRKQASTTQPINPRKAKTPAPATTHGKTMPSMPLTTATTRKAMSSMTPSSRRNRREIAPPATPTPASRQPARGRPDSHLPVHLRGVRYEDLPPEYQAISEHMKKKQPVQEEEEEDAVDFPALLALAEKTRRERDLKEAQEKATHMDRVQANVTEDSENISKAYTGEKRKRLIKVKQSKEFVAILPPSTFGVPLNIYDSSSEEEVEMEVDDSFSSSDDRGRRGSLPKKSRLRRSQNLTKRIESEESDGEEDDEEQSRPTKKRRTATPSRWHATERQARIANEESRDPLYDMKLFLRQSQAEESKENRPRPFLDLPPKESAQLRKEAGEYEEMKPRSDERLFSNEKIDDPELAKTVALFQNIDRKSIEEQHRIAAGEAPGYDEDAEKTPETGRALQEISHSLLNKEREKVQRYTPKNPSSLRNVKIMSPIAERTEFAPGIDDPEVVAAILAIPEEDIVEESFGPPPPDLFPQFSAYFGGVASSQNGTRSS